MKSPIVVINYPVCMYKPSSRDILQNEMSMAWEPDRTAVGLTSSSVRLHIYEGMDRGVGLSPLPPPYLPLPPPCLPPPFWSGIFLFSPPSIFAFYDFGFPIVNFPWLSGDVPRLPSYGIYISQLVRFARCCTSVLDFHSKNLQITSKLLTQGYRYHKLRKTFAKFFRSYSELVSKFGDISFQEYVFKGISHPVFYGDLVYKLRRVKDTPNFISSGSKIVKRLRRRQYDPLIIETTIGLVLGPCTALCRLFLKHCTLTNKAVGTI